MSRAPRAARPSPRGRGRRDGPRLLPRLGAARTPARGLRGRARTCRDTGKPVVIHTRAADDDTPPRSRASTAPLSCTASRPRAAPRRARARLLRLLRGERQLPERDGAPARRDAGAGRPPACGDRLPVPRPQPVRGRPNEPAYVMHTVAALAAARGDDPAELEAQIDANATALFGPVSARPKKQLGQHFLVDENILGVIGRLAELNPDDVMLEIGPGLGVLTRYLAARVALVHAVEIDRSLVAHLAEIPNVRLELGDALQLDLARPRPAAVQARLESALQRRHPDRRREPRRPARRSTAGASWCSARSPTASSPRRERRRTAPSRCSSSSPPSAPASTRSRAPSSGRRPNVDSALVAFRRRPLPERYPQVKRVVEASFAHRRKTLPNSLALAGVASRDEATEALDRLGRPLDVRAEALAPEDFVELERLLP